jgi:hypothetical protein
MFQINRHFQDLSGESLVVTLREGFTERQSDTDMNTSHGEQELIDLVLRAQEREVSYLPSPLSSRAEHSEILESLLTAYNLSLRILYAVEDGGTEWYEGNEELISRTISAICNGQTELLKRFTIGELPDFCQKSLRDGCAALLALERYVRQRVNLREAQTVLAKQETLQVTTAGEFTESTFTPRVEDNLSNVQYRINLEMLRRCIESWDK